MSAEIQPHAAAKARILVVDDSRVIRKAISKILGDEFDLIEAEDGEVGWERLLEDDTIQVVIADVEMPRLDGYSLICRIRASDEARIREAPVIIITGANDDETKERALACGATDFIVKPLDSTQLLMRARAHAKLDQTTRKLAETTVALEEQAAADPLTQLHSRRYFMQRGQQDLSHAKRHGNPVAVIRVDIDNFRAVYRKHGDQMCDEILVWLAKIFTAASRAEDTVARVGGGEFAVIVPSSGRREAMVLCERLRAAADEKPFTHNGVSIPVTISLGLAVFGHDQADTMEQLMGLAVQRLTQVKAEGGNRIGGPAEEAPPDLARQPPAPWRGAEPAAEVSIPELTLEEAFMEQPDMEKSLQMLAGGDGGELVPYLPDLMTRIIPLLEFGNKKLDLGLGFAIESLKAKIQGRK